MPLSDVRDNPEQLAALEEWMRSYRPEELFDATGAPIAELPRCRAERRPADERQPSTNGGAVLRNLRLPDFRDYAVDR